MFNPPPHRINWCYSETMSAYHDLEGVALFEGVVDVNTLDVSKELY